MAISTLYAGGTEITHRVDRGTVRISRKAYRASAQLTFSVQDVDKTITLLPQHVVQLYTDRASGGANTTLAAASAPSATNIKVTSVANMTTGDALRIGNSPNREVRYIATVGTAGSGGTGVDLTVALTLAHSNGDAVVETDLAYSGTVKSRGRSHRGHTLSRVYDVTCVDNTILLSADVIDTGGARTNGETDKARVEWLVSTFSSKGLTAGAGVVSYVAAMPDQDFTGLTLHEALTEVAKYSWARFYVDDNLDVKYTKVGSGTAPFNLSDSPNLSTTFPYRDLDFEDDSTELVNAVFVQGTGISGFRTDATSIAAYGRFEATLNDPDIVDTAGLNARGDAFLVGHANPKVQGKLTIDRPGAEAGMTIQLTNSGLGISAVTYQIISDRTIFQALDDDPEFELELGDAPTGLGATIAGTQALALGALDQAQAVGGEPVADLTVGGANLIPNSSFELADDTAWTVGADWVFGLLEPDSFDHERVARGAVTAATLGNLDTPLISVDPLDDFWLSAWSFLRSRTSGTVVLEALEYDSVPTLLATTTITSLSAVEADWTRHAIRFGPNTSYGRTQWQATTAFLRLRVRTTGSSTLSIDIDATQLERGRLLSSYAPSPYELLDGQLVGPEFGPGSIGTTAIADDAISTPKLQAGSVDTNKLAANAVVAGKIAAGVITSSHIATSGLDADVIKTGTLEVGGVAGAIDFIKVYNSSGQQIAYLDETGFYSLDPLDPDIWVRLNEAGLFLTRDNGVTFLTVMDQYGLHADAVEIGIEPGGSNLVPNSGMEIAAFTSSLSKTWDVTADWDDALSQVNLDVSGGSLNLNDVTY